MFVWFACYRSPLKEMVISSHSLLYMYVWASNIGLLAVCMELFLYNITLKLQNKTNMELYTVVFLLSCSYVIYNTSCMNYSFSVESYTLLFKKSMDYDANKLVLVIRSQMPSFMSPWVQNIRFLNPYSCLWAIITDLQWITEMDSIMQTYFILMHTKFTLGLLYVGLTI